jgi:phosphatidylglycerophosphate synthase
VLIMLIPIGRVDAWLVALLLCRELAITALRGNRESGRDRDGGRDARQAEDVVPGDRDRDAALAQRHVRHRRAFAGTITLWIATLFAVVSGIQYFVDFFRKTTVVA